MIIIMVTSRAYKAANSAPHPPYHSSLSSLPLLPDPHKPSSGIQPASGFWPFPLPLPRTLSLDDLDSLLLFIQVSPQMSHL